MAVFTVNPPTLINPDTPSAGATRSLVQAVLSKTRGLDSASAFEQNGQALNSLQTQIDIIMRVLRSPLPVPESFGVTDQNGELIAWIGSQVVNGVLYQGAWFKQLYIGGTDASTAKIVADANGNVTITGATITLDTNGVTTTIGNLPAGSAGVAGVQVKNDTSPSQNISVTDNGFFVRAAADQTSFVVQLRAPVDDGQLSLLDLTTGKAVLLNATGGLALTDTVGGQARMSSSGQLRMTDASGTIILLDVPGGTMEISNGSAVAALSVSAVSGTDGSGNWDLSNGGLEIRSHVVIDSGRNADFISLAINGTTRIDASGNVSSANGLTGSQSFITSVNFGASTTTSKTISVVAGIVTSIV